MQNLSALAQVGNITIILPSFWGFENFSENIYDGNLWLKAAKTKQRNMKEMISILENYNPNSEKWKTQKSKYFSSCKIISQRIKNCI